MAPIAAMQLEYSLVQRSIEREHLPLAKAHDIAVTAWSPLAGGILTGKYTQGEPLPGVNRLASMQLQPLDDRNRRIAAALVEVANSLGAKPSQLALAWIIAHGVIPIVGATSPHQMNENLAASDMRLDNNVFEQLNHASAFDPGHPYSMLEWDMPMALGYGGMFDQIEIPLLRSLRP